ncbi:S24 family peptidase [Sphingobacterium haloxyli]|uniref:Peptidase S24/S26A/S26B/S26C domain-containing protein n=1 Tax=Sphingobacterium haloxyli TaxID=2100533 RepID=A0A2S9J2E7_9SPHI|nr:S24 family peptidase [Sphingobacterium haloxyli]PRD46958.1 hypothetical protein C5745_12730 [Sphingobacterium haloxyli]
MQYERMDMDHKQFLRVENEDFFNIVRQRLDAGDRVRIPVVGKSMEPFLLERDQVLLQTANMAEIAVGDIVLARWGQKYMLHRVVRKKAESAWLAGDNNLVQLEQIAGEDIIALLVEASRDGRRLLVSRPFSKMLGMCWYYLRLPRRVVVAIRRRITNKRIGA